MTSLLYSLWLGSQVLYRLPSRILGWKHASPQLDRSGAYGEQCL